MRAPLLLVLLTALPAAATILWRGDFETQDLSQWDSYVVHPERWTFVSANPTPAQGMYAARVELQSEDYGPSNLIRTEVGRTPASVAVFQDTERWYAWSSMLSTDFPLQAYDHQLMFWECDAPIYQQEMSLHVNGTTVSFATSPQGGQYQTRWTGTMPAGVWHRFVLHVKWSLDPTQGLVELWYDGQLVVPQVTMKTMHDDNGTPLTSTMHHGLFLGNHVANKPVEVVYLDDVLEADSLADVQVAPDAGTDAGMDAGAMDGAVADAGAPDAGTDAGLDAGSATDGGDDAGAPDAGNATDGGGPAGSGGGVTGTCGCGPGGGFAWALFAVLLAAARRTRRE